MGKAIGKWTLVLLVVFVAAAALKDFLIDTPDTCVNRLAADNDFSGEWEIVYRLYYGALIPTGQLTFAKHQAESDKIFSLEATAKGSFLEAFLSAMIRLESRVNNVTGLPISYSEMTRVQGTTKVKEIEFDRENLVAHRGDRQTKITEDVQDPVSAFVTLLSQPLNPGQSAHVRLISEDAIYVMSATKTRQNNKLSEISVDISRENQPLSRSATFTMWVSSSAPLIPLLFKSWTPIGYISVILNKVQTHSSNTETNP